MQIYPCWNYNSDSVASLSSRLKMVTVTRPYKLLDINKKEHRQYFSLSFTVQIYSSWQGHDRTA